MTTPDGVTVVTVTDAHLPDLRALFEGHGNPSYCWCMLWRVATATYRGADAAGRRQMLESRVRAHEPVGLMAYDGGSPVAWCSAAPREAYERLERSRTRARLDDQQTWSIVCFFVARTARGRRIPATLLEAAATEATAAGAQVLEAYPAVRGGRSYRFMGSESLYAAAGFAPSRANPRIWRGSLAPSE